MKDFKFTHLGENLLLHPYKSLFWERHKMLLLADLHLGKAAHFRKSGIPVPEAIHKPDLERLSFLITSYSPDRIVFLGDLFHSSINNSWHTFKEFCSEFISLKPELVLGNHDILDHDYYEFMDVHEDKFILEPFVLSHQPLDTSAMNGLYNLCGHIHPSIRISGLAKQSLRVECFHFGKNHGILPAFGNFTGTAKIPAHSKEDDIFAIASQKILRLS